MKIEVTSGISEVYLRNNYEIRKLSMQQIASQLNCSLNKVDYWMRRYDIQKRTRSEAGYSFHNPKGDPFTIKPYLTQDELQLFGLGIGLYWGEGTKACKHSVRIGNSDPG